MLPPAARLADDSRCSSRLLVGRGRLGHARRYPEARPFANRLMGSGKALPR
jgi:hypothetical protein